MLRRTMEESITVHHNLNLETKKNGLERYFRYQPRQFWISLRQTSGVCLERITSNVHTMLNPIEYLGGLIIFDQPQNVGLHKYINI